MDIAVCALPQVLDAGLGLTLSVLQTANRVLQGQGRAPLFDVKLTGHTAGSVWTGAGLPVQVGHTYETVGAPDLVLLPGVFLSSPEEMEHWLGLPEVMACTQWLTSLRPAHTEFGASCAGTYVLAQSGLLDGVEATTTWWLAPDFRRRYPKVRLNMRQMVVEDRRFTTAGAALAQADLLLHLVARCAGPSAAHACARFLLLEERPTQTRYAMVDLLARQHPQLRKAEAWVRQHLNQPITVAALAQAMHLTPRTLARRFQDALGLSPLRFVQQMRIDHARHLLTTTHLSIEQVAHAVGYAQAGILRRLLVQQTGESPTGIRQRTSPARTSGPATSA